MHTGIIFVQKFPFLILLAKLCMAVSCEFSRLLSILLQFNGCLQEFQIALIEDCIQIF